MTVFLRLLGGKDKATALQQASHALRHGYPEKRIFQVAPEDFKVVPGAPFSYWISASIREAFRNFDPFEGEGRTVKIGMKTGNDFQFLRIWWESQGTYVPYAKGGAVESFYGDLQVCVNWRNNGSEVKAFVSKRMYQMFGNEHFEFWISNENYYFFPGITWSLRGAQFSPRAMPANSIFSVRGYSAFVSPGDELAFLALMNSSTFDYIFKCALGRFNFPEFIVGILQKLPPRCFRWVG